MPWYLRRCTHMIEFIDLYGQEKSMKPWKKSKLLSSGNPSTNTISSEDLAHNLGFALKKILSCILQKGRKKDWPRTCLTYSATPTRSAFFTNSSILDQLSQYTNIWISILVRGSKFSLEKAMLSWMLISLNRHINNIWKLIGSQIPQGLY